MSDFVEIDMRGMTDEQADAAVALAQRNRALDEVNQLRAALLAILDAIDYTEGACRLNEQVGAVLPEVLLKNAHKALGQ